MALFHVIPLEFVFIDQLKLVFSKPFTKKKSVDIPTSLDLIMIVVLVVDMDVLDAVKKIKYIL
jgi:hypothetical protein